MSSSFFQDVLDFYPYGTVKLQRFIENGGFMISVILPVYNEEKSIGKTIEDIIHNLKKFKLYKSSEVLL